MAEAQDGDESDSHTNSKSESKSAQVADDIHKEIEKFEDEDWNDQVDGVLQ